VDDWTVVFGDRNRETASRWAIPTPGDNCEDVDKMWVGPREQPQLNQPALRMRRCSLSTVFSAADAFNQVVLSNWVSSAERMRS